MLALAGTAAVAAAAGWTVSGGSTVTVAGIVGGDIAVASGATLAGTGSVAGNVSVAGGGRLVPGSPVGTLSVTGNLALADTSALDFGLGSVADRVQVGGNLVLDGVLDVSALSGFGAGSYRLFDYTGSLTDNTLAIGSLPAGYVGAITTGIAGQVNLSANVVDTTPDAFSFASQAGVALSSQITSAPVQITGINSAAGWTASGGQACAGSLNNCNCDVSAWGVSGTVGNNQYLCARHTSSASYLTATNTAVNVGGVAATFTSTTPAAGTVPNAFSFTDRTGVALAAQIASAPVQITGIAALASWTASGGQACASSGNSCSCDIAAWGASGNVGNNQYLCARHTSAATFATAADTTVTVGGVADTFRSTTLAPVTTYSGPTGSGMANVVLTGGGNCGFISSRFIPVSDIPTAPPAGVVFPQRLFDFTVGGGCTPGAGVTLTITYPQALPPGTQYWKYGPTSGNTLPHWYLLPATIAGNTAAFTIIDGGLGDDDLAANGTIVDQGGPGYVVGAQEIPALDGAALALLCALLAWFGWSAQRRRTRR